MNVYSNPNKSDVTGCVKVELTAEPVGTGAGEPEPELGVDSETVAEGVD
jgi:hypothetical protein